MSKRIATNVQTKAQEVAKEDYEKARALVKNAVQSRAYLYPVKGILYFCTHRALWKPFLSRLAPTITLSIGIVSSMFAFTYVPQMAILTLFNGPLAVFTTVVLVLNESSALVSIINRHFLLQDALLDTFDGTLVAKNTTALVTEGRQLKAGNDPIEKLGKILKNPFERFSFKSIIRYIMYLPLNFIPLVGTIMFIILQGRMRGTTAHGRYFQLKQWSSAQRNEWVEVRRGSYSAFGITATLLEMIPFVSIPFMFTNAVGAALWAADIEAQGTAVSQSTAPCLQEQAKKS